MALAQHIGNLLNGRRDLLGLRAAASNWSTLAKRTGNGVFAA